MRPLRFASLVAAGAMAVHELRYLIGGHGAAPESAGHDYLPLAALGVALLVAAACAQLLTLVVGARRTGRQEAGALGFVRAWLVASLSIAAVFIGQELLEGLIAGDRAAGLDAVLGSGGWVALPAAAAIGALVAVGLAGARAVVAAAARGSARPSRPAARPPVPRPLARGHRRVVDVLATNLASRAPPLPS